VGHGSESPSSRIASCYVSGIPLVRRAEAFIPAEFATGFERPCLCNVTGQSGGDQLIAQIALERVAGTRSIIDAKARSFELL
jgi:hypothetical protein